MKTLREFDFVTLCSLYVFGIFMLSVQYFFTQTPKVDAQTSYTATLIGGETNGVSDVCCNGVVLDFDSINPLNLSILDGEALFDPILSSSYDNGNEYSSGYNVLGNIMPWMCITVSSECESAEQIPRIRNIGTAGMMNAI
jgi:hypothetical protein